MKLSIVIVNWNARDMLRDCLYSVESGIDRGNTEIIVVDNGSADGSAAMVAERFPAVRLIANTDNRGFAAANNQAIRVARGELVLLLNNDTLVHGAVLREACDYMARHPLVAALGCRVINPDGSLQQSSYRYPTVPNLLLLTSGLCKLGWPRFLGRYQMRDWDRSDARDVDTVSGCFLMSRRDAIDEVGLLDEGFFFFGEETDWCRRFREAGWRVRFAPIGTITHFGSVSARRHDHHRDVMLTSAMVRLHAKHGGRAAAMAVWLLLLAFNASRAAYWLVASRLTGRGSAHARCRHFLAVVRGYRATAAALRAGS